MSQLIADPVAFRCDRCFNLNCATSTEVGKTISCKDCQKEIVVPEATPDRIEQGFEFMEQFGDQPVAANESSAFSYEEVSDEQIYQEARKKARSASGPEALVCSRTRRFLAALIDSFLAVMLACISLFAAHLFFPMDPMSENGNPMIMVVLFSVIGMYQLAQWVMTAMDGRTVGKYCLNIKVVNLQCEPPGFLQGVVLRSWVVVLLSFIPFFSLVDVVTIFTNDGNRCVHDYLAGTYVIEAS